MVLEGKNILVVEDDEFIGDIIIRHLVEAGATYEWAKDGAEGIEKLKGGTFDIILSDLLMPGMGGVEMLTKVKEDEAFKDIPVIVITNQTNDDIEVQQVSSLGINNFFAKSSTSMNELIARIKTVLDA